MSEKMDTPLLRGAWMGLALILLIALLPTGAMAITYVYSPMVIEEAGEYQLANDITNYDGVRWQNGTDFFEPCIKILASDVIFDGNGHKINGKYNATRVEDQVGIYVDSGLERVSVINTVVDGFNYGIYYYGVNPFIEADAGGRIWYNTVSDNDVGIILDAANNITVWRNTASNTRHKGIVLDGAKANYIVENYANNNVDTGIYLQGGSDLNKVYNNEAHANSNSSSTYADDKSLQGNGIVIDDQSSDNEIINNFADSNNLYGIAVLPGSTGNEVIGNSVKLNGHSTVGDGIYVDSDQGTNYVIGNTALNNVDNGIHLIFTDGSDKIINNIADGNGVAGILLEGCRNNVIGTNTVFNNKYGIELRTIMDKNQSLVSSDGNTLFNNTANENTESGIYFNGPDGFEPLINNILDSNTVSGNGKWGIHLQHATLNKLKSNIIAYNSALGILVNASTYNVVYNNIFFNDMNVGFAQQSNNPNTWSVLQEPDENIVNGPFIGGNWWGKPDGTGYSETAPWHDNGFCDVEFYVGPDNIDKYPLHAYDLIIPPIARFTMAPESGLSPLEVQFIDKSTGTDLTYFWDFDDGNTSIDQNPRHTFTAEGEYKIFTTTLTVSNTKGENTTSRNVNVGGPADTTVAFTAIPRSGTVPLMVSFLDQSTANPDVSTYLWDFGDGTSSERNPAHQYSTSGTYDVSLMVTTNGKEYSTNETGFIVVNAPGTVTANFFAVPSNGGIEPLVVQFYDQSSGTPVPTSWNWDFDDQYAPASEKISTLQSPIHNYTKAGNYIPKLTVSNSQGSNTKVYPGIILVRHIPPVANFSNSLPTTGNAPFSVTFTDQSIGQALTAWSWDFGDGGTSETKSPVYTFNTPGTYSVTFKSYNDGGWSAPIPKTNLINVTATPPTPPANIIKLYPGWNFVSTAKKLATGSNTVDVVFANVDMDHHSPLLYDGQTKSWIQFINGTIKPLDGIWVYSKYQIDVPLTFDTTSIPVPPSKLVYNGWNSIGETGVNPISAHDLLTLVGQLNGNWDTLIGYNTSSHISETYIRGSTNPEYSDLKLTFPTKGYWLLMNTTDTLNGLV